jgi:hypothetical protein
MPKKHPTWTKSDYRDFARSRGGKLVVNGPLPSIPLSKNRLTFQCQRGHQWTVPAFSVKYRGSWCQKCMGIDQRATIQQMKQIASQRGGTVVSRQYRDAFTPLVWRCALGHEFNAKPNHIKRGQWCPKCHAPRGERITREIFQSLFGQPFPKTRPPWLRSSSGTQMELDGYCEGLGIAFEHQGNQHYSHKYKSSNHNLAAVQQRDRRKRYLCRKHGVTLIIVPDLSDQLRVDKARDFIVKQCQRLRLHLDRSRTIAVIDLTRAYSSDRDAEELKLLCDLAKSRSGKLVSPRYLGSTALHEWECKHGHRWRAAPNNVKHSATWCPRCAGRRTTIDDMKALAEQKGGTCLSNHYRTTHHKLLWQCGECGHEWKATPHTVKRAWCPECGKKRIGEKNRANALARSRKMVATKCAGRLTLEVARTVAKSRGGECLSSAFKGANTKLLWLCGECHNQWRATPSKVCRKGTWCPTCAAKRGGNKRKSRAGGPRLCHVRAKRLLAELSSTNAPGRH